MADDKPVDYASVPDPEEDDLDDLDDVLEDFQSKKPDGEKAVGASDSNGPETPAGTHSEPAAGGDQNLAAELRAGMAELLGSIKDDPAMQAEFEKLMKGIDNSEVREGLPIGAKGSAVPVVEDRTSTAPQKTVKPSPSTDNFHDTIQKTMERMRSSGESASAAAASSGEDDLLAKMLKEMETGGFPGMDGGSEDDFNDMLMGMMEQLTSKEVLYEPMKELHTKFPDWLERNGATAKADDIKRYKEQQKLVSEIVARFDRPGYADHSKEDRDYIVERMQKMQAAGSPPPDLVGDMGAAQELMGDLNGGCNQQ